MITKQNFPCKHPLAGRHLDVSFIGLPPFIIHDENKTPKTTGAEVDIIKIYGKRFGFEYTLQREMTWFLENNQTGKYEGSVGKVGKSIILGNIMIDYHS